MDPLEDRVVPADLSALAPFCPLGSLVYQATGSGSVSSAVQSDSFTLDLEARQTLSLAITPDTTTYALTASSETLESLWRQVADLAGGPPDASRRIADRKN